MKVRVFRINYPDGSFEWVGGDHIYENRDDFNEFFGVGDLTTITEFEAELTIGEEVKR